MYEEKIIRHVLWELGIPPSYIGSHYLAHAVRLAMEDPGCLLLLTKLLYPKVARQYRTNWKAVERSLRTCVAAFYRNGGAQYLRDLGCNIPEHLTPGGIVGLLAHLLLLQSEDFWREPRPGRLFRRVTRENCSPGRREAIDGSALFG